MQSVAHFKNLPILVGPFGKITGLFLLKDKKRLL